MQRLKIDIATTEKILAHNAVTGGLVGVYQRHSYLEEMRAAFERYHAWLDSLVNHYEPPAPLPTADSCCYILTRHSA